MKRCISVLTIITISLFLVSCINDNSDTESSEDTSESETVNKVYAIVTKEESNQYMKRMADGFQKACEELDIEYLCLGPADYSAEAQVEIIEKLIESQVDVIAISANEAEALEESLQKAKDAGIIVLSLDSAVTPESRYLHIQQVDPEKMGRVLIEAAASMISYSGTVGVISTTGYMTNQNLWLEWLEKELDEHPEKYQDIKVLPVVHGDDDYDTTVEKTQYLLDEYPELDIIITTSAVSMVAVGDTLREQNSDVIFTGLGLPSEMAEFIEEEKSCKWFYLWNPIDLGYLAAYSAYALDEGIIDGELGGTYKAGSSGQRVVTESVDGGTEVLMGDPLKFDSENIAFWKTVY